MRTGTANSLWKVLQPGDHRRRFEAELGDNAHRNPGVAAPGQFLPQRIIHDLACDPPVAFGMSSEIDQLNSVLLQRAGFEHLEARPERTARLWLVASDQEQARNAGLPDRAREKIIQRTDCCKRPRRDVRDRVKAGPRD